MHIICIFCILTTAKIAQNARQDGVRLIFCMTENHVERLDMVLWFVVMLSICECAGNKWRYYICIRAKARSTLENNFVGDD